MYVKQAADNYVHGSTAVQTATPTTTKQWGAPITLQ